MESVLNNLKPIDVVPSFASVEEFALYTIASVEESYTEICKSIGIDELAVQLEASDKKFDAKEIKVNLKKLVDKFVAFVKELWQKIEDLCKKARDRFIVFITDKIKTFTDKKVKYEDLIKVVEASKPEIWDDDKYKTSFVFSEATAKKIVDTVKFATEYICGKIDKAQKDPETLSQITDEITVIYHDKFDNIKEFNKDMTSAEIQAAVRDAIFVSDASTQKDGKAYVLSLLKEDGKDLLNKNNMLKTFTTAIADPYNKAKKSLDDTIKQAKKNDTDKAFQPLFKLAAQCTKMYSAVIGGVETAYFKRFAFEYRILLRSLQLYGAWALSSKKESAAPEVTDETTVATESSTFQTELASLFNF